LANKLLKKAHVALGFDRCDGYFVSAAPIETKILKYYASIDVPIMELFGQSECTGPHAVNNIRAFKIVKISGCADVDADLLRSVWKIFILQNEKFLKIPFCRMEFQSAELLKVVHKRITTTLQTKL